MKFSPETYALLQQYDKEVEKKLAADNESVENIQSLINNQINND